MTEHTVYLISHKSDIRSRKEMIVYMIANEEKSRSYLDDFSVDILFFDKIEIELSLITHYTYAQLAIGTLWSDDLVFCSG